MSFPCAMLNRATEMFFSNHQYQDLKNGKVTLCQVDSLMFWEFYGKIGKISVVFLCFVLMLNRFSNYFVAFLQLFKSFFALLYIGLHDFFVYQNARHFLLFSKTPFSLRNNHSLQYEMHTECSIAFEVDGPYHCMMLPAANHLGKGGISAKKGHS